MTKSPMSDRLSAPKQRALSGPSTNQAAHLHDMHWPLIQTTKPPPTLRHALRPCFFLEPPAPARTAAGLCRVRLPTRPKHSHVCIPDAKVTYACCKRTLGKIGPAVDTARSAPWRKFCVESFAGARGTGTGQIADWGMSEG